MTCRKCGEGRQIISVIGYSCPVCGQIAPLNLKELDIKLDIGLLKLMKNTEFKEPKRVET